MKRALVSVTDKTNIVEFCRELIALGYEIVSTGGTRRTLTNASIESIGIEEVTGFQEILDGRVKTLHPFVHGGLLYCRNKKEHVSTIEEMGIKPIDMVVVNLYEFEKALKEHKPMDDLIENIDIGGPSMLRSAAKNFKDVLVVSDVNDYEDVIEAIKHNNDDYAFRMRLAYKAFCITAAYDSMISRTFGNELHILYPEILNLSLKKVDSLRYGENPQQRAALYEDGFVQHSLLDFEQLNGKKISFNNMNDLYGAVAVIREFKDEPNCVTAAIKHSSPCGVAIASTPLSSYTKAYEGDPVSIFGGIVATNYTVDKETAEKMSKIFLEIIAAPDFSEEALSILSSKKNLRVLKLTNENVFESKYDIKYLEGKVLVQDLNTEVFKSVEVVTKKKPTNQQLKDMEFGMKVIKLVKSNAILIVKDGKTLAINGGQTSRIWALQNCINNNPNVDFQDAVLVSDAFFPFDDCVKLAASVGISAIIQPGGSIRDHDSIVACDENEVAMVFSGHRHFRH